MTVTRRADGRAQMRRARAGGWTNRKRADFLAMLAQTGNVKFSANSVGMSDEAAHMLRRRDARFACDWQAAKAEGFEALELWLLEDALASMRGRCDVRSDAGGSEEGGSKKRGSKTGDPARPMTHATMLSLLAHNRHQARDLRDAAAHAPAAIDGDDVRDRVLEKLATMRERLLALSHEQ